jgi:hypothetical protein
MNKLLHLLKLRRDIKANCVFSFPVLLVAYCVPLQSPLAIPIPDIPITSL